MDQIYVVCFKILSPWENYGLQHWCREWIELDALKRSQVSIPCQTTLPKSPCLGQFSLPVVFGRQRCCHIWLVNSVLDQFPTSSKERFLSETRRLNITEKFQELKLEFGLFEGQVLPTEIVGAWIPGQNFTCPSHDQKMYVFMMHIFCPQSTAQNMGVCSQDYTSDNGDRF